MSSILSAESSGSRHPAAGEPFLTSLPMGVVVSAIVLATIAGVAGGTLLHDASPALAWLVAIGLCGGVFSAARWLGRSLPTASRFITVLALAVLTCGYLMSIGSASVPRPAARDVVSFAGRLAMLLASLGLAVVLPFLLALMGLVREGADRRTLRVAFGPLLLGWAVGAGVFVLILMSTVLLMWATPRPWLLAVVAAWAMAVPVLFLPIATAAYGRLLARWMVSTPPALARGLQALYDRTGFAFGRTLCLDPRFGGGYVCLVIPRPGRPALVMSESLVASLPDEQLLAVLAHEAAHVRLNHAWRKAGWAAFGALGSLIVVITISVLMAPWVPRSLALAGMLAAVLPVVMLRGLYETYVTRRHEAEADEYAVDVAGAEALLGALESLSARGIAGPRVHHRWTTHGTWEQRVARIRECEEARSDRGPSMS
jgi:Zn-dependent protease with chaperone function